MKTYLECIPCFLRQALEASRMATHDDGVQAKIIRRVLRETANFSFSLSPPHMGQKIHRIVREETGDPDPYRAEKLRYNMLYAQIYPQAKKMVARSENPRDSALKLAVASNVLDFGPPGFNLGSKIGSILESALSEELAIDDRASFWRTMEKAEEILYLGDNTGEVFFDRLLLEHLPVEKVTFVVRGGPAINDITMGDLDDTGLNGFVSVVDNGSDAPGTILEDCSPEFRQRFEAADLIISKGQGNYETLSGIDKHIFYLLKAKCPVLARDLDVAEGSLVVKEVLPKAV
ncbi:MAG: hypothetical protein AMJ92_12795 [candidate division Zixibacteria bacterium SM23_81]|nr:MAG: hypothetical protein AMJ92_12795 [candidate division Zixibacteria bacterium SM23_81]